MYSVQQVLFEADEGWFAETFPRAQIFVFVWRSPLRLLVALSRNTVKLTSLTVWGLIKVAVRAGT